MNASALRNRLLLSMLLGVLVFAGLLAYGDFKDVGHSLDEFRWELFPLILLVTCGNYLLRFVKWEYYLRAIGVRGLARLDSFLIFFSGLGMVVTPGKVGEWLKSYLLRELHGTPFTRSAPILLAERMTDSLALLILGGAGVLLYGNNTWPYIAIIAAFSLLAIAVSRHRPTARGLLGLLARLPFVGRFAPRFEEMYESTYVLMDPRAVVSMTLLSVVSWSFEVLAFYLTLVGVGADASFDTLSKAAFILPISTLAAAIFLTPGGLIVAEIGITKLSQDLVDLSKSAATVGTLIIRVATLWFGVVVGLIAFAFVTQRLNRLGKHLGDPDSADAPNPQSPLPAND